MNKLLDQINRTRASTVPEALLERWFGLRYPSRVSQDSSSHDKLKEELSAEEAKLDQMHA